MIFFLEYDYLIVKQERLLFTGYLNYFNLYSITESYKRWNATLGGFVGKEFSWLLYRSTTCRMKLIAFDITLRARTQCDFFESVSQRVSCSVQRAACTACSQACGAGAFVRGIGSRPAPRRCNARVTDYLRHTLPAVHCRYTQASRRATCSPDRSIWDEIEASWKAVHLRDAYNDDPRVQARPVKCRHPMEAWELLLYMQHEYIYLFIHVFLSLKLIFRRWYCWKIYTSNRRSILFENINWKCFFYHRKNALARLRFLYYAKSEQ